MALHAYLQVGLSFADVGIFEQNHLKAYKRLYLPQEPLTPSLKKFWAEHGIPSKLSVCSRLMEKILEAKLGGTVAQVVTSGFETWPILRQPLLPLHFHHQPYRKEPLASQELIFGLSERINNKGEVLKPLDLNELEFINSKLKLMGVKRVCVNLLFANRNPVHQKQVASYFQEQGFEVLSAERTDQSEDEMPAWRRNVINACLSGAFTEHIEEIQKSLPDVNSPIHFLNQSGEKFLSDKNQIAGSLFASMNNVATLQKEFDQVLYLGLENWFLISTQDRKPHWESPWGSIESSIPSFVKLQVQPTSEINRGFWGGVQFSKEELGYQPGPMCFGRALKPTVFDLVVEKEPLALSQIQPQGCQKFRNQFNALIKNIPELQNTTVEKLIKSLFDHLINILAMEGQFQSKGTTKRTFLTGTFAPALYPYLQNKWFDSELVLDSVADLRDLQSLAEMSGAHA